jgi:hypothetical protein
MKFTTSALLSALAPLSAAFPAALMKEAIENDPQIAARALELIERQQGADAATALFEPANTFNAEKQYIDISEGSGHEYVAPGPNDLRGPCPGLNAFANHGFIPHNGYATTQQFIDATEKVVGMGPLLAGFLSLLGSLIDGDGTSWSIGGTPPPGVGGPLAHFGKGISGSHNKYEGDASPTRPDLYEEGNDYKTKANQFQDMIDASPGGKVTINSLTAFRSQRFDEQIANNPYFFNGAFSGIAVQPAAYTFIFRFMANHSEADPVGLLSYDTLATWFGIEGENGNYKAVQGAERIPENWYRRAQEYPYELTYFVADLLNAALIHPKFLSIGGNLGKTNSFAGVDVANLTGGLFNSAGLLEGNNLACFAFQTATTANVDLVSGLLGPLAGVLDQLGALLGGLSCPQLQKIDDSQLKQFPGYTRSQ